jgi:hypothetical protein
VIIIAALSIDKTVKSPYHPTFFQKETLMRTIRNGIRARHCSAKAEQNLLEFLRHQGTHLGRWVNDKDILRAFMRAGMDERDVQDMISVLWQQKVIDYSYYIYDWYFRLPQTDPLPWSTERHLPYILNSWKLFTDQWRQVTREEIAYHFSTAGGKQMLTETCNMGVIDHRDQRNVQKNTVLTRYYRRGPATMIIYPNRHPVNGRLIHIPDELKRHAA